MIPAGPYNLALNVQTRLDPPDVHVRAIILENHSPFDCAIETQGLQKWLPPYTSDVYPVSGADSVIVIPKLTLTPGTVNTLLATWMQDGDPIPQGLPQTLTADAIAGAISNLGVADTLLTPSPFTQAGVTGFPGQAFSIPAGSPSFSNLLIGFENVGASTATVIQLAVVGRNSGITYLDTTTLKVGQFITCLVSSVADPSGVFVQMGGGDLAGHAAVIVVVGQANPSVIRQYRNSPTDYASGSANPTVLIPSTGVAGSIVRVWSAWVSVEHPTAFCDGTIQVQPAGNPIIINAQTPTGGGAGANNVSFPGGQIFRLLLATYHIDVTCSAGGSVRGGIAWSVDI